MQDVKFSIIARSVVVIQVKLETHSVAATQFLKLNMMKKNQEIHVIRLLVDRMPNVVLSVRHRLANAFKIILERHPIVDQNVLLMQIVRANKHVSTINVKIRVQDHVVQMLNVM